MADARAVANHLIALAHAQGRELTPMQLLKLTYIAHGFALAVLSKPLIFNAIEAWPYGPVIPDLYHKIKHHRDKPVSEIDGFSVESIGDEEKKLIEAVFENYCDETGVELSNMTHMAGTPWSKVFVPGRRGQIISDDLIEDHYRDLVE